MRFRWCAIVAAIRNEAVFDLQVGADGSAIRQREPEPSRQLRALAIRGTEGEDGNPRSTRDEGEQGSVGGVDGALDGAHTMRLAGGAAALGSQALRDVQVST